MTVQDDTIVALSTPPGAGARAIIRLSGAGSFAVASSVSTAGESPPAGAYSAARTRLRAVRGHEIGATIYVMKAPHSYTGEDVAELHVPGSPAVCSAVIRGCLRAGARAALPGEFTFRAFMNGRIDLSQAEAVDRIIRASDSSARRAAVMDAGGRLSVEIGDVASEVKTALSLLEALIDFSDQETDPVPSARIRASLESAAARARAAAGEERGSQAAPEPLVLLAGGANAGKSSLLNALARERVSIVSEVPGTTRDVVTRSLVLCGRRVTIADPAGIGGEPGEPGAAAARMFLKWLAAADVVVAVLDGSAPQGPAEERLAAMCAGRACIRVQNKADLPCAFGGSPGASPAHADLKVSALTGAGLPELAEAIALMAGGAASKAPDSFGLSARQRAALSAAADACDRAVQALEDGAVEISALEARDAIGSLGLISGRELAEEVLGAIFSGFCVGK